MQSSEVYVSMYVSMYVCMYVSMYVCMYLCMVLYAHLQGSRIYLELVPTRCAQQRSRTRTLSLYYYNLILLCYYAIMLLWSMSYNLCLIIYILWSISYDLCIIISPTGNPNLFGARTSTLWTAAKSHSQDRISSLRCITYWAESREEREGEVDDMIVRSGE
jgi:hypothetical protein